MRIAHPFTYDVDLVVMAGDWHGNRKYARWAITTAALLGAEGIIQLGDFGIWPGVSGQRYLDGIEADLEEAGLWMMVIDGNHEDFTQLYSLPLDEHGTRPLRKRLWHVPRGHRWTWHGKTWLGLGGATSLDRKVRWEGRDWWAAESITAKQAQAVIDAGPADMMVTHDCPLAVDIPGLAPAGYWDPHALEIATAHRRMLDVVFEAVQPAYLWHGHFHVRYDAKVEFAGKPCQVTGLDGDGVPLDRNIMLVNVPEL